MTDQSIKMKSWPGEPRPLVDAKQYLTRDETVANFIDNTRFHALANNKQLLSMTSNSVLANIATRTKMMHGMNNRFGSMHSQMDMYGLVEQPKDSLAHLCLLEETKCFHFHGGFHHVVIGQQFQGHFWVFNIMVEIDNPDYISKITYYDSKGVRVILKYINK